MVLLMEDSKPGGKPGGGEVKRKGAVDDDDDVVALGAGDGWGKDTGLVADEAVPGAVRLPTDGDGGSEEDNADVGVDDPACGGFTVGSSGVVVSGPDGPADGPLGDTMLVIVEIITVGTPLFVWVTVEVRIVGVGLGAGDIDHVLVLADGLPRFDDGMPEGVLGGITLVKVVMMTVGGPPLIF